jgi:hypothetical protein
MTWTPCASSSLQVAAWLSFGVQTLAAIGADG